METNEPYETYLARMQSKVDPKSRSKIRPSNLQVQVNTPKFWPTPRAADGEKNLRSLEGVMKEADRKGSPQDLLSAVRLCTTSPVANDGLKTPVGGQLNPTWIEWLMGFPSEWSALNDLGMQWFHSKPGKLLKS
jgi:hypothetical protein